MGRKKKWHAVASSRGSWRHRGLSVSVYAFKNSLFEGAGGHMSRRRVAASSEGTTCVFFVAGEAGMSVAKMEMM
jgi:hypothetical protein